MHVVVCASSHVWPLQEFVLPSQQEGVKFFRFYSNKQTNKQTKKQTNKQTGNNIHLVNYTWLYQSLNHRSLYVKEPWIPSQDVLSRQTTVWVKHEFWYLNVPKCQDIKQFDWKPRHFVGSYLVNRVLTTRLVQWLSWVFATQDRYTDRLAAENVSPWCSWI